VTVLFGECEIGIPARFPEVTSPTSIPEALQKTGVAVEARCATRHRGNAGIQEAPALPGGMHCVVKQK